jgi:RNA polymerase sigma-70 factor (ECF subfamily)
LANESSFEVWYEEHYPHLLAAMVVAAGQLDLARDVTDEAFARAFERWPRVGAMASPTGWTYSVALNVLRRRERRRAVERRLLAMHARSEVAPPTSAISVEVWDAVRSLAPRARAAVALRYLSDLREAEVAEVMGLAPGTVARMLHDARNILAERLSDQPEVGPRSDAISIERTSRD